METVKSKVVKLVTWYAGSAAVAVAIILPLIYFTLSYQNQTGAVGADAEINRRLTSQGVNRVVAEDADPLDPPILAGLQMGTMKWQRWPVCDARGSMATPLCPS